MKNVKPKAGHIYECITENAGNYELGDRLRIDDKRHGFNGAFAINFDRGYSSISVSDDFLCSHFIFIPQNDLEWLACDDVKIPSGQKFAYFSNHIDRRVKFCKHIFKDGKTQQEIQNMRFELGLDKDPVVVINNVNRAMQVASDVIDAVLSQQKETKMIDLSAAVVGDKFVLSNGKVVSFFARTKMNSICEMEGGYAMLYTHDGKFDEGVEHGEVSESWCIVSKHDPRHWLKDLPDADLFLDDVDFIHCDSNSEWLSATGNDEYYFNFIKMPTLTGDEWKLSKISIVELRAWQQANKG